MKLKLASFAVVCGLLSSISCVSAATDSTQAQIKAIQAQIQDLNKQVKQLPPAQQKEMQKQIDELQSELDQVKAQQTAPAVATKSSLDWSKVLQDMYPRSPFVFATPYLGTPSYDASDLITNWPSINEDATILAQRQKIENILLAKGRTPPDRPIIDISGYVEGKVFANNNFNDSSVKSGLDLSTAEVDLLAEINRWASAYIAIDYQSGAAPVGYSNSNSELYVDRGFLTIGNLNVTPFYASIGLVNVPFGTYDNFTITDPLTLTLGKTKEDTITLGFADLAGFYGSVYVFGGETYTDSSDTINNGGINLGYKYSNQIFNTNFGAGIIANIADAKNTQGSYCQGDICPIGDTGAKFQGFGFDNYAGVDSEHIAHNVPALDLHATFNMFTHYNIFAEYVTALRSFDVNDLSYNGQGALVSALNLEFGYTNKVYERPYTLAIAYQQSWESLALGLPQYSLVASAALSYWRSTVEKIEYRHDINYDSSDTGSGGGIYDPNNSFGGHRDTVQAVIDFYF